MARITFTQDVGPSKNGSAFPKLKLAKDETARIACLEQPIMVYVHTLEKPKILNGKAVMEEKQRKDKTTYTQNAMKYVTSFLCPGDDDVMSERGVDPENCLACKASTRSDEVKQPKPKFAMNVIKYGTRGSGEISSPFNVDVEAWVFSNQQYSQLRKLVQQGWDLQTHDLILGPCSDESYQRFEIVLSQQAAWMADEDTKKRTLNTFKENKASDIDLELLCARKVDSKFIEQDLEQVHDAWLEIQGIVANPVDKLMQQTDEVDMSRALEDVKNSTSSAVSSTDVVLDFDALMKGL